MKNRGSREREKENAKRERGQRSGYETTGGANEKINPIAGASIRQ